ncbi:DMP19 family protein [Maribacter sp. Asnod2-G09]|uniref:DMP19 family protein n=1 Tax=Maribacter sp. Asnod2-G09 TaxID=3160577 RepID=UPI00386FD537
MDREDMIVMEIDTYLNEKSKYGEEMEKLNSSQRVLLIIENLEREINNGGFDQFYWNSSGDYAMETINALKQIGANKTAEIVKKANDKFPNGIVPENRDKRGEILEKISEESSEYWNNLDTKFYAPNKEIGKMEIDNIPSLLIDFIKENKSDFEK